MQVALEVCVFEMPYWEQRAAISPHAKPGVDMFVLTMQAILRSRSQNYKYGRILPVPPAPRIRTQKAALPRLSGTCRTVSATPDTQETTMAVAVPLNPKT